MLIRKGVGLFAGGECFFGGANDLRATRDNVHFLGATRVACAARPAEQLRVNVSERVKGLLFRLNDRVVDFVADRPQVISYVSLGPVPSNFRRFLLASHGVSYVSAAGRTYCFEVLASNCDAFSNAIALRTFCCILLYRDKGSRARGR